MLRNNYGIRGPGRVCDPCMCDTVSLISNQCSIHTEIVIVCKIVHTAGLNLPVGRKYHYITLHFTLYYTPQTYVTH